MIKARVVKHGKDIYQGYAKTLCSWSYFVVQFCFVQHSHVVHALFFHKGINGTNVVTLKPSHQNDSYELLPDVFPQKFKKNDFRIITKTFLMLFQVPGGVGDATSFGHGDS